MTKSDARDALDRPRLVLVAKSPETTEGPHVDFDVSEPPLLRPSDIDRLVGREIEKRRKALGMSTKALGVALGVPVKLFRKYEWGQSRIDAETMVRLSKILGVSPSVFFQAVAAATQGQRNFDGDGAQIRREQFQSLLQDVVLKAGVLVDCLARLNGFERGEGGDDQH